MADVDSVKKELERLHGAIVSPDMRLEYLRTLSDYVAYTKTEPLLKTLLISLREDEARASISDIQKSVHDPLYRDLVHAREAVDSDVPFFPFYDYKYLEEAEEDFSRWKGVKTEDELSQQQFVVKKESEQAMFTSTKSGHTLLVLAEHVYPKQLESVHSAFLRKLDEVKQRGLFSKYLDYDSAKGILYFQEKEVRINNRKIPTNADYLLAYLFANDPFAEHYYEDMEAENALFERKSWKSYYDACVDIQKKVKEATSIDDLLDFSSGSSLRVRFNPKYSLNPND